MKRKGEKEEAINKEEIAESYCFVCKEGGDLLICDHRDCLKCYHDYCVGKNYLDLEIDDHWVCDRHTCFSCRRSASLYCYTCKTSVCRRCLPAGDILKIKGKFGLCDICLKLAFLIEENKDYDSDGAKVDFTDISTAEGLFREYYIIIKKEEGFDFGDICAAVKGTKTRKKRRPASCLDEYEEEDEEEEDHSSDYDGEEDKSKCKKGFKRKKHAFKSNKTEFVGWASRSLAEFLAEIGRSSEEKLLQCDVASIINEYVKKNNLLDPKKRKMIQCDARLYSVFRKRMINRNRINELLDAHFAENYDESEEDDLGYDLEEYTMSSNVCKRQRKSKMENESPKMDADDTVDTSCFAAIVVENIKLVYLKRSLLRELLEQPKTFEEKVTGCFVRVKSDPRDYSTTNSHQLKQVEGLKKVSNGEINMESILLLSAFPKEIPINLLSDDDFSEEECEELRNTLVIGQLKRATVGDLQKKAKILHEDITKHWIKRELDLLQRRMNLANEKGWRREYHVFLEKKKMLETPSEQSKLLASVPKVIPDV